MRRNSPNSPGYTKKLCRLTICSSRFASSSERRGTAMRSVSARGELPVRVKSILNGRVRGGCRGDGAGEGLGMQSGGGEGGGVLSGDAKNAKSGAGAWDAAKEAALSLGLVYGVFKRLSHPHLPSAPLQHQQQPLQKKPPVLFASMINSDSESDSKSEVDSDGAPLATPVAPRRPGSAMSHASRGSSVKLKGNVVNLGPGSSANLHAGSSGSHSHSNLAALTASRPTLRVRSVAAGVDEMYTFLSEKIKAACRTRTAEVQRGFTA
ncbi:hypothetical protein B0H11DRAFT_1901462 [Mycena galericulata]|nr:hypothetical protein B0H11DRAFT_1901462 [Mycena galericulata]